MHLGKRWRETNVKYDTRRNHGLGTVFNSKITPITKSQSIVSRPKLHKATHHRCSTHSQDIFHGTSAQM